MSDQHAVRKDAAQETAAERKAWREALNARNAAELTAAKKAKYAKAKHTAISQDYALFAFDATQDIRSALDARQEKLGTNEAQPMMLLWCALARRKYARDRTPETAAGFAEDWCADPAAAMEAFSASGNLAYVERTPMSPSRDGLRRAFGLDALDREDWLVLCSGAEHERRRDRMKKQRKRSKASATPAAPPKPHVLGERPWERVGCSRATWYRWTPQQRDKAVAAMMAEPLPF